MKETPQGEDIIALIDKLMDECKMQATLEEDSEAYESEIYENLAREHQKNVRDTRKELIKALGLKD